MHNFVNAPVDSDMIDLHALRFHDVDEIGDAGVDRPPGRAAVVGSKETRNRNAHIDPARTVLREDDGVEAKTSSAFPPFAARLMFIEARNRLPGLAAIDRLPKRGRFQT